MKRRQNRLTPSLVELESRRLLAVSMVWHGQDDLSADYMTQTGNYSPGKDDFVDTHITINGLPQNATIQSIHIGQQGVGASFTYSSTSNDIYLATPTATSSGTLDIYFVATNINPGSQFDQFWITYNNNPTQVNILGPQGSTGFTVPTGYGTSASLRVPGHGLTASKDVDGPDLVGASVNVGSDGQRDVHLHLTNISRNDQIAYISIDGDSAHNFHWSPQSDSYPKPSGSDWDAEIFYGATDNTGSGLTSADLYFQTPLNTDVGPLTVTVQYYGPGAATDSAALSLPIATGNPVPPPSPFQISYPGVSATWVGQTTQAVSGALAGSVHIALSGLPTGRSITSMILGNQTNFSWVYPSNANVANINVSSHNFALTYVPNPSDSTKGNLYFAPNRNEASSGLSLRINYSDNSTSFTNFAGMATNINLVDPALALPSSPRKLTPSDAGNLQTILNDTDQGDRWVELSAGIYNLTSTLVLNRPVKVTIAAGANAILRFSQPTGSQWSDVITLNSSHISINSVQIDFATSLNFPNDGVHNVNTPSSVIHVTSSGMNPVVDVSLNGITFKAPIPASGNLNYLAALAAVRTDGPTAGSMTGNTIIGMPISIFGGPWVISGNDHQGAVNGSTLYQAFDARGDVHDLQLINNRAHQVASGGQIRRFLYQKMGTYSVVSGNDIYGGLGTPTISGTDNPIDRDGPEVILTDLTEPFFVGIPSRISSDGRVVQLNMLRTGVSPTPGFVVSIMSSSYTGQRWFRVAQVVNNTTLLMEDPLPSGYAISLNYGYINNTYDHNTVDLTGMWTESTGMAFEGAQFGLTVSNNVYKGVVGPLRIDTGNTQTPTNDSTAYLAPDLWARLPAYDVNVTGNEFDDTLAVGLLHLSDGRINPTQGQVYYSGTFTKNVFNYSSQFLSSHPGPIASTNVGADHFVNNTEYLPLTTQISQNTYHFGSTSSQTVSIVFDAALANSPAPVTLPASPSTPSNLSAVPLLGQVKLSWAAVPNATNYYVERSSDGITGWTSLPAVAGGTTTYTDPLSAPLSDYYYYRIRALTSGGYSPYSATVQAVFASFIPLNITSTFNQVGITNDDNYSNGQGTGFTGIDTTGHSYSSSFLGNSITWSLPAGNAVFNLGQANANNVVQAGAVYTIPLSGSKYSGIAILGAAVNGVQTVTFSINYASGSSRQVTQQISDWVGGFSGANTTAPGETIVKSMAKLNSNTGQLSIACFVYGYYLPIDPTRAVTSVTIATSNNNNFKILGVDPLSPVRSSYSRVGADFNGDGISDIGLYSPGNISQDITAGRFMLAMLNNSGQWATDSNSNHIQAGFIFGTNNGTGMPVTGDFNRDGYTDVGVYTPGDHTLALAMLNSQGVWDLPFRLSIITFATTSTVTVPVTGDFNGDGITDVGIYLKDVDKFIIQLLDNNGQPWGTQYTFSPPLLTHPNGYNIPVTGDFNGDGVTDLGVYLPAQQAFKLYFMNTQGSLNGLSSTVVYGPASTLPFTGDFNGDGITDVGVHSSGDLFSLAMLDSQGQWNNGTAPPQAVFHFGDTTRIGLPITGDFNVDGKTDVGYYTPDNGKFAMAMLNSQGNWPANSNPPQSEVYFGPVNASSTQITPLRSIAGQIGIAGLTSNSLVAGPGGSESSSVSNPQDSDGGSPTDLVDDGSSIGGSSNLSSEATVAPVALPGSALSRSSVFRKVVPQGVLSSKGLRRGFLSHWTAN